jgi:long-chain fatty acid transport protein
VDLYGSTGSDQDINPIPTLGFVVQPKNSDWAYGLGGFAIGGFGVDYPTDPTNPILTPQPPIGMGFGSLYSQFQMMQFAPTVACRLTERVSVGTSVNFDWGTLAVSPFSAAFPDDANGNGFPTYPSGAAADARWGMGIQTGVYFDDPCTGWHLGMSYKSTQWFQEFKINSHDELGLPRQLQFDLDYPAILSFGTAYSGWERVSVAMDIRYIDYASTDGFALTGFGPDGAVQGFSWDSIWVVATGVQYELTDAVKLRAGYQFNESPIDSAAAFYNVLSPALVQHHLSCGFSATLPAEWIFSMAYHYGFEHSVSGPWYSPAGPIPGTEVKSSLATHILGGGISKQF